MNADVIAKLQEELLEAGVGTPRARVFFVKSSIDMEKIDRTNFKKMTYYDEDRIYNEAIHKVQEAP